MIGWIANVFLIAGIILAGKKWVHAFALTFVGEILWTYECLLIDRWDMIFLCAIFSLIAFYNWLVWVNEDYKKKAREPDGMGKSLY